MTCPTCLRPVATEADAKTWAASPDGTDTPENWPDPDGSHLCWRKIADGHCEPPEWWAAVTPLEVQELRADIGGAYRPSNALYDAILKRLEPHFPAGDRGLDWDVLPSTIGGLIARLKDESDRLTPRWRDGEPPSGEWVLRERPGQRPLPVLTFDAGDAVEFWTTDSAEEWGTARWCPIGRPV